MNAQGETNRCMYHAIDLELNSFQIFTLWLFLQNELKNYFLTLFFFRRELPTNLDQRPKTFLLLYAIWQDKKPTVLYRVLAEKYC